MLEVTLFRVDPTKKSATSYVAEKNKYGGRYDLLYSTTFFAMNV